MWKQQVHQVVNMRSSCHSDWWTWRKKWWLGNMRVSLRILLRSLPRPTRNWAERKGDCDWRPRTPWFHLTRCVRGMVLSEEKPNAVTQSHKRECLEIGFVSVVVNECDWEVRYHMAMKSSGPAPLWKSHPSPSESHGVLRRKQKQLLIDYDNHHLNQGISTFIYSSLHSCSSSTFIYSTPPQGFELFGRTPEWATCKPSAPTPLALNTHIYTHARPRAHSQMGNTQTHKSS